jgi:hypothetical protein
MTPTERRQRAVAAVDVEGFRRAYRPEADSSPADHAPVTE